MIDARDRARVLAACPVLADLEEPQIEQFMLATWIGRFREGQDVMGVGDKVGAIPLVLSGRVRVSKTGDSGRVITIYHFGAGECWLSRPARCRRASASPLQKISRFIRLVVGWSERTPRKISSTRS